MHSELSYGLSIAPKLQRVGSIHILGWDQPTPDPSFSLIHVLCLFSIMIFSIFSWATASATQASRHRP